MKIIRKLNPMRTASSRAKSSGAYIGFVPTLGFLHKGHEGLVKRAKKENRIVVVSCFVNRPQFRQKAYRDYPRDEKRDIDICEKLGVDFLFMPGEKQIYPTGFDTKTEVINLADRLEGKKIRWSYRGVTTIVAKLFNIVAPDRAYFGQKDPHQIAIIKRMTADLDFPVKIVSVPTVRDRYGVPLSSRLSLLSDEGIKTARVVSAHIKTIKSDIASGFSNRAALTEKLRKMIEREPLAKVDFVSIVDADTLCEDVAGAKTLVYAAVYIGGVRVTDNMIVKTPL